MFSLVAGICGAFNTYVNPVGIAAMSWKFYFFYVGWILVQFVVVYLFFPEVRMSPLTVWEPMLTPRRPRDLAWSRLLCSLMERMLSLAESMPWPMRCSMRRRMSLLKRGRGSNLHGLLES